MGWVLLSKHISDVFQSIVCLANRMMWMKTSEKSLPCMNYFFATGNSFGEK